MTKIISFLSGVLTAAIISHGSAFVALRPLTSPLITRSMLLDDVTTTTPSLLFEQHQHASNLLSSVFTTASADVARGPPEAGGVSYSKASYYTILGLYVLSFPGVWSQVKRSTSAKIKRKTFVTTGENSSTEKGKSLRQEAGEIMACKLYY